MISRTVKQRLFQARYTQVSLSTHTLELQDDKNQKNKQ